MPAEHQIRGLGPIVLTVHELSRTAFVLTEVMNMRRVREYAAHGAEIHVFAMGEAGGGSAAVCVGRGGGGSFSRSNSAGRALKTSLQRPQRTQPSETFNWSWTTLKIVPQWVHRVARLIGPYLCH